MSKKYKLIKEFPLSPEVGFIADFTKVENNGCLYDVGAISNLFECDCKDWPDFWELIKEPEFQILAAKTSVKVSLTAKNTSTEIYKVLRLYDNEIFAVGDKCNLKNGNGNRNPILRFEIRNESFGLEKYRNKDRIVVFLETMHKTEWGPIELDSLVKYKKPLFITEDGVEVFKEGDFFIVDTDYNQEGACYFAWSIEKLFIKNKSDLPVSSCVKIFSTEKTAKEYIDLNKPQFSKKDLLDASINMQYDGWFIEGLIKRLNK